MSDILRMKPVSTAFFILLFACTLSNLNAQLGYGLNAGVNLSSWVGTGKRLNYASGFSGGGLVQWYISDQTLVGSGVYYSREGWKYRDGEDTLAIEQVLHLHYLTIPFGVEVYGIGDRYKGLWFRFGVEAKFLMNYSSFKRMENQKETVPKPVEFRNFDLAGVIGAGYQLDRNFSLYLDIQLGLFRINTTSNSELVTLHNQLFRIGIIYLFNPT
jgi:hypothetical protein